MRLGFAAVASKLHSIEELIRNISNGESVDDDSNVSRNMGYE